MLSFFRSRRPAERIATSFRWLEQKPLPETRAPFYSAVYARGAYVLTLVRESCFAWETLAAEQRYSDIVLEAEIEIDPANGHSAAGVLFRHVNDENFYSMLVSSRGNYRVDLLFNNHPIPLVDWTRLPEPEADTRRESAAPRRLRVVANGSRFSFIVDEEWVGEIEDEVLPSGGIGFAAQNFTGTSTGIFRLRKLVIEARPAAAEREHLRWSYYLPVSPVGRIRFAETLFASGSYQTAAVQLRKALKDREGTVREHFLLSECYTRLSLFEESLAEIEVVLAREPAHPEARMEKANLLYLGNRVLEARDSLQAGLADGTIVFGPGAWNLLGNAEYGLGNWQKAADAYRRAAELQPDTPLFLRNAARSLERADQGGEAVELYLRAARLLFSQEAFDELSLVVPRVRLLAPENPEVQVMEAKMLYREGKTEEAFAALSALEERGSPDSAVSYLIGIILASKDRREEALPRLQHAADLEPDFPLYQFRLAETLHMLGRDPGAALDKALLLAPEDPWTNNLAGQLRIQAGDPGAAVAFLQKARTAAPAEEDICLNLCEALSLSGRHEEAIAVVEEQAAASGDNARMANQRGNVRARQGEYARAVAEYETAIRLDPNTPAFKENCAAACIEIDMVHRAEELLSQVEPEHPSPSVYNLLGTVAALKGERLRAELSFNAGLALDPGNQDLMVNLALLQRERGNHERARELLRSVVASTPSNERARRLLERIRDEREMRLSCAACRREWWVPKNLPPQPAIRVRGEPPAEAPAGRCPQCDTIYCVACASAYVRDMRLCCPKCGELLKLSDDSLKWLLAQHVEGSASP